jgi:RHS repeat-associated protein
VDTTTVINASHGVTRIGAVGYTRTAEGTLVSLRDGTARGYYLHDGLGSIAAVTDHNGTLTNRYTYDPYGATTVTCPTSACLPNPWQYTGEHHDEATGLYKIGHRYYQPTHGRWTQPDPLSHRTNPVQPTEAHPYAYVGCNPTNYTDPSGLYSVWAGLFDCGISVGVTAILSGGLTLGPGVAACAAGVLTGYALDRLGVNPGDAFLFGINVGVLIHIIRAAV